MPRAHLLRIHLVEDRQVGDCCFFNAQDHREAFHVGQTWALNVLLGTGTARSFRHFYSKPPRENVMLTVVADTVRNHWGNMGGRCSRRLFTPESSPMPPAIYLAMLLWVSAPVEEWE